MSRLRDDWGSDTPISAPQPVPGYEDMRRVEVGEGMVMTPMMLAFNLNEAGRQERYTSHWRSRQDQPQQHRDREEEDDG